MARYAAALLCLALSAIADVKVGQPAPEISLDQLLPDQPVTNASLRVLKGKAVVLEFWATWCGPCIMAIPHLNELASQFKDKPIVFLSITSESRAEVEPFLKRRPIEGLVGLARNSKVMEDYGVTSLARTFLIDAEGNMAADLTPDKLTAGMLDDLLAQRPISVPKAVPFSSAIRLNDDPLARPLFDVMIRPATTIARVRGVGRGDGELMMKAVTLRAVLPALYAVPPSRMTGDAMEDKTRYDIWISLPGAGREAFQAVARNVICAAFHLDVRKETLETDVYLLTAPNGKPPGLVEATPTGGIFSRTAKGRLNLNGPLISLARLIENVLGKPVIDETGLEGAFDIKLIYQDGVPGSLEEAVRALGFKLEPARRPIGILRVGKAQ